MVFFIPSVQYRALQVSLNTESGQGPGKSHASNKVIEQTVAQRRKVQCYRKLQHFLPMSSSGHGPQVCPGFMPKITRSQRRALQSLYHNEVLQSPADSLAEVPLYASFILWELALSCCILGWVERMAKI